MGLRRSDIVLWLAWVAAGALANMLTVAAYPRAFGASFGYEFGSIGFELSLVLAQSFGLAILQFAILRVGVGSRTWTAIVWAAVTVTAGLGDYVATYLLLSSPTAAAGVPKQVIEIAMSFAYALVGGFCLGAVLWATFRLRSALLVWPAALVIAFVASYALFSWPLFQQLLMGLPFLAELLVANGLNGVLYGAVTGAGLVMLVRRRSSREVRRTALSRSLESQG